MINNLEHRGLDKVRLRGPDGFKLAVGLSVVALNIHRLGLNLLEAKRKRMRRDREPQPGTSHCAPPERRFPENRPTERRPAAEPAPNPRKTDADARMSALGAEPDPFPRKNALRKTPGKPAVRKIRTFSGGH